MHLFIQPYTINPTTNTLTITHTESLMQIKNVLRMKVGSHIAIQDQHKPSDTDIAYIHRHTVRIISLDKNELCGEIIETTQHKTPSETPLHLWIAFPNKSPKAEVIVQKLTEIGIQHIHFWHGERSIREIYSSHKQQRIQRIAHEAVEQSYGWIIPEISYTTGWKYTSSKDKPTIICMDLAQKIENNTAYSIQHLTLSECTQIVKQKKQTTTPVWLVIGPEGGLTTRDYTQLHTISPDLYTCSLGANVLRMETASIIAGWFAHSIVSNIL